MNIRVDDLNGPEILQLLREHLQSVALHLPPESVHALGIEALRKPEIKFWTVWQGSELMGCGALKELDATHGEIKSMRTASAHLRKGVAAALMVHFWNKAAGGPIDASVSKRVPWTPSPRLAVSTLVSVSSSVRVLQTTLKIDSAFS